MITFIFEHRIPAQPGFSPNLSPDPTALPGSAAWWNMSNTAPYVGPFRFLKYLDIDNVEYACKHYSEIDSEDDIAIYPIWVNIFDPNEDYISYIHSDVIELVKREYAKIAFFYSEGDDPTIDIIDNIFDWYGKYDIPLGGIKFVIANYKLKDTDPFIYFPDDELHYRALHLEKKDWVKAVNLEQRQKKFTCLNRMDKPFRRLFAASLWNHGIHKDGYFSYNMQKYDLFAPDENFDPNSNYWAPYVWDQYFRENNVLIEQFLLNCPFYADGNNDQLHNDHRIITEEFHRESYWNFVVETHYDQDTVFLTEKTFKPILNLQPFIIVGNPGSINLLHDLGYKTFDGYNNESYDKENNHEKRMWNILTECIIIGESSHEELTEEIYRMRPILEYNQRHFLSSKKERLVEVIEQLLE